jgi:hypothetical protein
MAVVPRILSDAFEPMKMAPQSVARRPRKLESHTASRRSSAVTVGSGSQSFPIVGSGSGSGTGLTDTRVASRNPSYTSGVLFLRGGL